MPILIILLYWLTWSSSHSPQLHWVAPKYYPHAVSLMKEDDVASSHEQQMTCVQQPSKDDPSKDEPNNCNHCYHTVCGTSLLQEPLRNRLYLQARMHSVQYTTDILDYFYKRNKIWTTKGSFTQSSGLECKGCSENANVTWSSFPILKFLMYIHTYNTLWYALVSP